MPEPIETDLLLPHAGPAHGGNLRRASVEFGIDLDQWLDLSTGINPDGYPIPPIPEECFYRLPGQHEAQLLSFAREFYGAPNLLMGAGSQPFIERLPTLREPCRVAIPDVGYQEHAWHWQRCGHEVVWYSGFSPAELDERIQAGDVECAVVINPNNPTASVVSLELLLEWRERLAQRQGLLIVDEAFAEMLPGSGEEGSSMAPYSSLPGVCVLRSVGKFFGLAGIRVGFTLASNELLMKLSSGSGLWSVSAVSQYLASQALSDQAWQAQARQRLLANSEWMDSTLRVRFRGQPIFTTPLFASVLLNREEARAVYYALASEGVLTRLWCLPGRGEALIRFGMISAHNSSARARLVEVLKGEC